MAVVSNEKTICVSRLWTRSPQVTLDIPVFLAQPRACARIVSGMHGQQMLHESIVQLPGMTIAGLGGGASGPPGAAMGGAGWRVDAREHGSHPFP
jgi:hypothetical protein